MVTGNAPWAIVFAGGIGSRFWPLSSPRRPKPTLQLLGERPLIAGTVDRLAPVVLPERVLIVTSRDIANAVARAAADVPAENILVEPRPLGTSAALAWALEVIKQRGGGDAPVCALHADLAAGFPDQFRQGLTNGMQLALSHRALVTLGVVPTRPETAFGYAQPGAPLDAATPVGRGGACRVSRFVEKPGLDVLTELLSTGALWHAGVLIGAVNDMSDDLFDLATEIGPGRESLSKGNLPEFAAMVQSISIERGLLQRCNNLIVVPVECGWDDVGTWACLRRSRDLDDAGNGAVGEAHFVESTGNVVHTEAGPVVLYGCQQMLVVSLQGITFVTTLEKAADLRALIDQLPQTLRVDPTQPS
jgi:mannose-1-phosphate guanylyltransferase